MLIIIHKSPLPHPAPCTALRWFDSTGGNNIIIYSIFVCWLLAVREDSGSTPPTTARRGTRFELLDGRRGENENENDNDNGNGNGNDNDNEKSVKSVVSDVEKKTTEDTKGTEGKIITR